MKYDYTNASKICIWRGSEPWGDTQKKYWFLSLIERNPIWLCHIRYPVKINNGDEIDINEDCKIDINGRVIIKNDEYLLIRYDCDVDFMIKINKILKVDKQKTEYQKIMEEMDILNKRLSSLQHECKHLNATRKNEASTGNYDPLDDKYWTLCSCPDCGLKWIENEVFARKRYEN